MTFNRYDYADNNPYRYIDPTGDSPKSSLVGAILEGLGSYLMEKFPSLSETWIGNLSKDMKLEDTAQNQTMGDVKKLLEVGGSDIKRVFWSGGDSAKNAAAKWASENNGVTLEMTPEGRNLTELTSQMEWNDARPLWEDASRQFAQDASGEVNVFLNKARVRPDSIWNIIEQDELLKNPNVTNIVEHNL